MSDPEILLSICVPTFNRQFLLERNVSFHLREFRRLGLPFELVLVDDCSTDGTADYLASLAGEPEVQAHRRIKNSGFVSNYAFAMRRARGRYAVFLGDDDLLIPEKVAEYVGLMEQDAGIGMVQAPWLLVDARPGGGDMGPFYHIQGPSRIARGDFDGLLQFILSGHIFPEFLIVRRDVLVQSISSMTPFIFWAFLYTARALGKADILFVPEPFARVTAISDDPRLQQGNTECMYQWDTYRGGLEYIASLSWQDKAPSERERLSVSDLIARFMNIRQSVALSLQMNARNWVEAYILYHRMSAHGPVQLQDISINVIRSLAGATVAATEAGDYAALPAIVDPAIGDDLLALLSTKLQDRLTRALPVDGDESPRAWLRIDPTFGEPLKPGAVAFELPTYLNQFI
jgi:glycosyltransferase involved in cell wall biosynthesis